MLLTDYRNLEILEGIQMPECKVKKAVFTILDMGREDPVSSFSEEQRSSVFQTLIRLGASDMLQGLGSSLCEYDEQKLSESAKLANWVDEWLHNSSKEFVEVWFFPVVSQQYFSQSRSLRETLSYLETKSVYLSGCGISAQSSRDCAVLKKNK